MPVLFETVYSLFPHFDCNLHCVLLGLCALLGVCFASVVYFCLIESVLDSQLNFFQILLNFSDEFFQLYFFSKFLRTNCFRTWPSNIVKMLKKLKNPSFLHRVDFFANGFVSGNFPDSIIPVNFV